MQFRKLFYLLAIMMLGLSLAAHADIIGNGPPNNSDATDISGGFAADNFTTGLPSFITQVQFWAAQGSTADYTGSIYWAFYSDVAGAPGSVVASGSASPTGVATGNILSFGGLAEYVYTFDVNTQLASNTTYWLALHNGPWTVDPNASFYWAWSASSGNSQVSFLPPFDGFSPNASELAFQVTAVPEPASLCLIGTGLVTGWFNRRKLQKKN